MAQNILDAYTDEKITLIEAGTGTGKSLSYLVPAAYWALKHQEKTVIATHTIALQEQLIHKDIPFLLKAMDIEIKACLVKGMSNYLCLRKLSECRGHPLLFATEEAKQMEAVEQWSERTKEGSRSDISFPIHPATWEKVSAEADTCNHVHCPHYKECFFFKARKMAEDSQLLIVNHHLLLADIEKRRRNPGQGMLLPNYSRLVIDEAHQLESVALESFAQRFDRLGLLRQLSKLHSDVNQDRSRLARLHLDLSTQPIIPPLLIHKLEVDIPAQKRLCQESLEETFGELISFFETLAVVKPGFKDKESRRRITEEITQNPLWKQTLVPSLGSLGEQIQRLSLMIQGALGDIQEFKDAPFYETISIHLIEMGAIAQRLDAASEFLNQFVKEGSSEKRVRWLESTPANAILVDAALDISALLNEHLFSKQRTCVLCSATITAAKSFSFLKKRLGLTEYPTKLKEAIFDSPFNYQQRTLFVVPTDLPLPSSPDFLAKSIEAIAQVIEISRGSVFLLFTSYEMLQSCHRILSQSTLPQRYSFFKQGDLPRHLLLEQFKKKEGGVLFATDSFWEGVDVPGEALRCVVIAKLPFSVPSDPLYEGYALSLEKEGLDPFFDYSVPEAVIKFKQGFGRLMRTKDDRGCVVCLDHRIVKKSYGKQFLLSLPPCPNVLFAQSRGFHRNGKIL